MKKSILLPILLAMLCSLSWGAIYLVTHDKKMIAVAKEFLVMGSYQQCEETLASIHPKRIGLPLPLYKGYLALMQRDFVKAKSLFEETKNDSPHLPLVQLEASIAEALCAYYTGNTEGISVDSLKIDEQGRKNQWYRLVHGMTAFQKGAYATALSFWGDVDYHYIDEQSLASTWGAYCIKTLLSEEHFELKLARALIEENNFILARELLERTRQNERLAYTQSLISMYLGYSYLKEAAHNIDAPVSYYKLAAFYFERTSLASLNEIEQQWITSVLSHRAKECIKQDTLAESFFYVISPLQKWQCIDKLQALSELTVEKLSVSEKHNAYFLQKFFEGSTFHHMITDRLTEIMIEEISKGKIDLFSEHLNIMNALAANTFYFQQRCVNHILVHLDHAIMQDDENLCQLNFYLKLLEDLDEIRSKAPHLVLKLIEQSKILWQENGKELKATRLMQIALALSPNKLLTKGAIEDFLSTLFDQAEASNLVERLNCIYDALLAFNIKTKSLMDPSILANHLADAHYRFQTREFLYSKILTSWVLKLDPDNQEALRLLGLNYYHLGNYQEAIIALQKLFFLDEDSYKALVISEVFSSHNPSHLTQIDTIQIETVNENFLSSSFKQEQ